MKTAFFKLTNNFHFANPSGQFSALTELSISVEFSTADLFVLLKIIFSLGFHDLTLCYLPPLPHWSHSFPVFFAGFSISFLPLKCLVLQGTQSSHLFSTYSTPEGITLDLNTI